MTDNLLNCFPVGQVRKPILDNFSSRTASLGFARAFHDPRLRLRHLAEELAEGRAQVLGVTEMRPQAGAEFRLVDEFVGLRTVLERCLRAQEQ